MALSKKFHASPHPLRNKIHQKKGQFSFLSKNPKSHSKLFQREATKARFPWVSSKGPKKDRKAEETS